jgi:hypothetical protein
MVVLTLLSCRSPRETRVGTRTTTTEFAATSSPRIGRGPDRVRAVPALQERHPECNRASERVRVLLPVRTCTGRARGSLSRHAPACEGLAIAEDSRLSTRTTTIFRLISARM